MKKKNNPGSLATCCICQFQMAEIVESVIPFHGEPTKTKYFKIHFTNLFQQSLTGKINKSGGRVYKNILVVCSETHPSLLYKGQAAERISGAFSELLGVHVCHFKAYKTHLLVTP